MSKSPLGQTGVVNIIVTDADENSFSYHVQLNDSDNETSCRVSMNNATYLRFLAGTTTFEIEAGNNNIEVSGDSNLLRNFGKSLRNSN